MTYTGNSLQAVFWFTGLSGAGKTTIGSAFCRRLRECTISCALLDGDVIRKGLCDDLGFSAQDRDENQRRVAHVARLLCLSGIVPVVTTISPLRRHRAFARSLLSDFPFFEVFVDASLEVCRKRDVKGLYASAARQKVANFTGLDSPYEPPPIPDIRFDTTKMSCDACVDILLSSIRQTKSSD